MKLIRISESDDFIVDYDEDRGMYRVSVFDNGHFWDEFWFEEYQKRKVSCENIKDNLDNRICDCLENATNTETYREFIVNGYKYLGCDLSEEDINDLSNKTNKELNGIVYELNWLLNK